MADKVLITTGYPYDNGVFSEVIDVNNSNVTCETSLPDFPLGIAYATGGLLMGRPLICGGESNYSRCYFLDNLDFIDLSQPRIGSDGIVLNETTFFIIGGARNFTDNSTELVDVVAGITKKGPEMP